MTRINPAMIRPKQGLSTGRKVGIGCAVAAFVMLAICGGGGYFVGRWFFGWPQQFVQQGYVKVDGQAVEVTEPVAQDTVYVVQSVVIRAPVSADIAIWCQTAEIHGVVEGDIDFLGQTLLIAKESVVTGDIRAALAQEVTIEGVVEGKVSGQSRVVNRGSKKPADGSANTSADGAGASPSKEGGTGEAAASPER